MFDFFSNHTSIHKSHQKLIKKLRQIFEGSASDEKINILEKWKLFISFKVFKDSLIFRRNNDLWCLMTKCC